MEIKAADQCKYDILSLGEVMLRLDPGPGRIHTARCFNPRVLAGGRDSECRKQYKSKCYICKSAKEIILIINEEQYHFS